MRSCRPQKQPPARIAFSVVMMLLRQSRAPAGASARFTHSTVPRPWLFHPPPPARAAARAGHGGPESLFHAEEAPGPGEAADAEGTADLLRGHADRLGEGGVGELE